VTGQKSEEPTDMKKQKKLQRRKSVDKEELNVPCRSLGKADHEGWLYKKGGVFLTKTFTITRSKYLNLSVIISGTGWLETFLVSSL